MEKIIVAVHFCKWEPMQVPSNLTVLSSSMTQIADATNKHLMVICEIRSDIIHVAYQLCCLVVTWPAKVVNRMAHAGESITSAGA